MVCYARPASRMAALVLVVLLVFGRPVGHFFDDAALIVAIAVAVGGAALLAAVAFTVFLSTRQRRAVTGGCVSCQFRCQHAMTEQPRLVASTISQRDPGAPRWPDRPAYRSGPPAPGPRPVAGSRAVMRSRPGSADQARRRERTGAGV
jgi:hypothetical protein